MQKKATLITLFATCLSIMSLGTYALGQEIADSVGATDKPFVTTEMITLPGFDNVESYKITIKGPKGYHFETEFSGENVPFIDTFGANGELLANGQYAFELKMNPIVSQDAIDALQFARATGDMTEVDTMRKNGLLAEPMEAKYGYFTVVDGNFIVPGSVEETLMAKNEGRDGSEKPGDPVLGDDTVVGDVGVDDSDLGDRAQTFATDLIVQGSACVGVDCTSSESFGFDTLKLKENNLRIKFDDTSASASFPGNDWQLTANESDNGGLNKFSVDDITGGKTPFTLEAGAPNNSLYVDDAGNIGVNTATPVVEVHIADGDSPTLRLEQNGSSGFTPQTWDLAGNETNFFVRDVTNSSKLPFKIKPGAPTNSLYLDSDTQVGLFTQTPDASFHVEGGSDGASALVTASGDGIPQFKALYEGTTAARREMFFLSNYGEPTFRFSNTDPSAADDWSMILLADDSFLISRNGSGAEEMRIFNGGNVTIGGSITELSDVNSKENFENVDPLEVLDRVTELPITTWNYIKDEDAVRHMGPMAQDFASAFGLGSSNTGINGMDVRGVVIAAIQGLNQRVDEKEADLNQKDETINQLQKQNADLNKRLEDLERMVQSLADNK